MTSLSESPYTYENKPQHLQLVTPIDFKEANQVPDTHAWNFSGEKFNDESVPVIDLTDPNSKYLIKEACEKWGAFQVTNHGVAATLLDQIEGQMRRLFSLPEEQKLRALRSPDSNTGYGVAPFGRFYAKRMWSEGFTVVGSPEHHAKLLWPDDYTSFCDVVKEYLKEAKTLSAKIGELMLSGLELTHEDVKWFNPNSESDRTNYLLQINHYPACPDPDNALGFAPHTDTSMLTMLYQSSNAAALQVLRDGAWLTVSAVPGSLIVLVGDLLQILSNGRFKAVLHRARVNREEHRISIAHFYGPPPGEVKISPLSKLSDEDHPPLYRPVTWKEYLDLKATHFGKAFDLIRQDADVINNDVTPK